MSIRKPENFKTSKNYQKKISKFKKKKTNQQEPIKKQSFLDRLLMGATILFS